MKQARPQTAWLSLPRWITALGLLALIAGSSRPGWAQHAHALAEAVDFLFQHFDASDHEAHHQNEGVVQGADGVMYFGNRYGVLTYDGSRWVLLPVPEGRQVHALAVDSLGRVFVGGDQEFGLLVLDARGALVYQSLLSDVPPAT